MYTYYIIINQREGSENAYEIEKRAEFLMGQESKVRQVSLTHRSHNAIKQK